MTTPGFRPTHVVPPDGMPARDTPDPVRPAVPLDPLLPVRLVERHGDWGHVLCANGWSAWVDGRLLVALPREPPAAGQPLARTADPRPLLARAEETLGRYRQAVEDLAAGHLDGAEFHARTRGLRAGVVVEGEAMWLYEAEHERWVYCDGTRLCTYAAPGPPGPSSGAEPPGAEGHAPTQVVPDAAPEPTQVVRGAAPEPTEVVRGAVPEPTEVVPVVAPEPTEVVPVVAPEPTQVVPVVGSGGAEAVPGPVAEVHREGEGPGHAPTRAVDGDG